MPLSVAGLSLLSAARYDALALADLFNAAFASYMIPVQVGPGLRDGWIKQDSLEIGLSRILLRDDQGIGIGLVARRGWTSRLAAFAIEPGNRRQGVGRWFLQRLLDEARDRGDQAYVLECIEQNPAGIRLYQNFGFETERRLVGYTATALEDHEDSELVPFDIAEAARWVAAYGAPNLPWQISAPTLAQLTPPHAAYRLGPAVAIVTDPEQNNVSIKTLVVATEERRQKWGTRLLQALAAQFPGRAWRLSPHYPEEIGPEFFARLGFQRDALTQLQMRRPL